MYTTPLAPRILFLLNIVFIKPVTPAVIAIIISKFIVPYFSSIIGPINRIYRKFDEKCFQLICPITWVNSLMYVSGLKIELLYDENNTLFVLPLLIKFKI